MLEEPESCKVLSGCYGRVWGSSGKSSQTYSILALVLRMLADATQPLTKFHLAWLIRNQCMII